MALFLSVEQINKLHIVVTDRTGDVFPQTEVGSISACIGRCQSLDGVAVVAMQHSLAVKHLHDESSYLGSGHWLMFSVRHIGASFQSTQN